MILFCVEAKDDDKKESAAAASSVSSSVLNLAGIGSLGKERRQHNGVSVVRYDTIRDAILTCARKPT